ncbi:MAG: hypothetical protein O2999_14625 [Nitrospirae bacterium]|nr:hypothetical protein [Nitrospirota bacterium]MDA1305495.1 hypothetical protein [Nitrospirota bacterium]
MNRHRLLIALFCLSLVSVIFVAPTTAISPIFNDPEGFEGLKWGVPLHTLGHLALVDPDGRIQTYQFKENSLRFADTTVETFRLLSIDHKFARVMIRYHGESTHHAIMKYLTSQYGPVIRRPGSMVRGLNQENTWRGTATEANLNYREHGERGFLMIQSQVLAPRFLDLTSSHSH